MVQINRKKEEALNHSTLQNLLQYDPETGDFIWRVDSSSTALASSIAGHVHPRGYIIIRLNGEKYYAHRLAWFYYYQKWPTDQIDHKDQNKSNNKINNLRDVCHGVNTYNTPLRSHNTSGARGVSYVDRDKCWRAYITINKKRTHLGSFRSFESAVAARKEAELKYGHKN